MPPAPVWIRLIPFFLSALFFLSAFFAVIAPLPILLLFMRTGRRWAWAAVASNLLLVGLLAGASSALIYLVFVAAVALTLGEALSRRFSVEKSAIVAFGVMLMTALVTVAAYSFYYKVQPWTEVQASVTHFVDYLTQTLSQDSKNAVDPGELEAWKQELIVELPSAIGIIALVVVWANLVAVLRVNPKGIRDALGLSPGFTQNWKTPEWLVWPTILTGFFVLVNVGVVSDVSRNLFKFLMAVYAIQGLSILSFLFDTWNIRGIFRAMGFVAVVFLMMPLLLSLGFFDLWFDFRSKFRQS